MATLEVNFPPIILVHPQSKGVWPDADVTLEASAYSPFPLSYQWFFNNEVLTNANSTIISLTNVQLRHEGAYTVVATDAFGAATSQVANVVVMVSPVFVRQPRDQIVLEGGDVTFRVSVTGTQPLGYYWRRNKQPLVWFPGSPSVTITNVSLSYHSNRFDCIVTNLAQPFGECSAVAFLTVLVDQDRDGMADIWELEHALNPADPADAFLDSDLDGFANRQEFDAGTDPRDPESYLRVERLLVSNEVRLEFQAQAHKAYLVLHKASLTSGPWQELSQINPAPSKRLVSVSACLSSGNRFFRITTISP